MLLVKVDSLEEVHVKFNRNLHKSCIDDMKEFKRTLIDIYREHMLKSVDF